MKILIAPDKFKGSLNARDVAENIAAGLREVLPKSKINIVAMADGGEGTAEVICEARQGSWVKCDAHDPIGREIEARYVEIDNRKLAVMEMSEVAGMRRLPESERDPLRANTFGVGEMILAAANRGAREIVIGLGGSATNDGGVGMARALGFRFFEHLPSPGSGAAGEHEYEQELSRIVKLEWIQKPKNLALPKMVAAVDVRNPLLGENGATRVFGPQKGATENKIDILERALGRLSEIVAKDFGIDYRDEPGAGAAGGLGFGLMSFCSAVMRPGFEVVAESVGLESKMEDVDVVITGEGSLDRQTLEGKTPAGVAQLARKLGKRVFAIVGRASEDRQVRELFDEVYVTTRPGMSEKESIADAAELLRDRARELAKSLDE
ncbi:MAG: glycerate kinase [Chthoniobacterales bacterium]